MPFPKPTPEQARERGQIGIAVRRLNAAKSRLAKAKDDLALAEQELALARAGFKPVKPVAPTGDDWDGEPVTTGRRTLGIERVKLRREMEKARLDLRPDMPSMQRAALTKKLARLRKRHAEVEAAIAALEAKSELDWG